jgi:putative ABC transport system ATP-binding protein
VPLLELKNVGKHYRMGQARVPVLSGIDLQIAAGEMLAIGGPSGSGKSTLCNLFGLIDEPSEGEVLFEGQATQNLSDGQCSRLRSRRIGFVFQRFNLLPVLTALENVSLPLHLQSVATAEAKRRAAEFLDLVGLSDFSSHRPDQLSGGQQQRVALARALVTRPGLVIADEPTANLDTNTALDILNHMQNLNEETGTCFVFATHDDRLLTRVARRLKLEDGRIIEDTADPVGGHVA